MKGYWALKFFLLVLLLGLLSSSCKTRMLSNEARINTSAKAHQIIKKHYKEAFSCNFLSGSIAIDFKDSKQQQSVTLSFRMEKDKAIWMSAPLGLAKIYITPEKVSFYNKLDNIYFEGGFDYLSQLAGIDLDFQSLQNLLLGQALFPLNEQDYSYRVDKDFYTFGFENLQNGLRGLYAISPGYFRVGYFEVSQPEDHRFASARYNYQKVENQVLPATIKIVASQADDKKEITLNLKKMQCENNLRFPFKIPQGYKRITFD